MTRPGESEGIRVLEDFVCEAVAAPPALAADLAGETFPDARREALRTMTNAQLLALLRGSGGDLGREELRYLRGLARDRMGSGDPAPGEPGGEVSLAAVIVAFDRAGD